MPDLVVPGGLEQNLEQLESTTRPVGLQGFAEVGVRLRLFDRNQENIQAAQADLERSRAEVTRIESVLRERAAAFVEDYRTAKTMVDRYRSEILPRAQRAYALIYRRYGLLQASYPQVLRSERALLQVRASRYPSTLITAASSLLQTMNTRRRASSNSTQSTVMALSSSASHSLVVSVPSHSFPPMGKACVCLESQWKSATRD